MISYQNAQKRVLKERKTWVREEETRKGGDALDIIKGGLKRNKGIITLKNIIPRVKK